MFLIRSFTVSSHSLSWMAQPADILPVDQLFPLCRHEKHDWNKNSTKAMLGLPFMNQMKVQPEYQRQRFCADFIIPLSDFVLICLNQ